MKIAVLDTGIEADHPDFQGRIDLSNIESFISGESTEDGNGHGTHCAGIVGGRRIPANGTRYAVAPDVELLIGKVLDNTGRGHTHQILAGLQWAADQGARVISMSIQILRSKGQRPSAAFEQIVRTLLDEEPGVLVVAAAGNASSRPYFVSPVADPAACESILAVAAVDHQRQIAKFSCGQTDAFGDVNCSAPGVAIRSAWPGRSYKVVSGTSMATPHVAGVAALWLEQNPSWTARRLWQALEASCAPPSSPGADFGRGIPQAPSR